MHSCTCPPRQVQTLADRINAIIAKYETCPCPFPDPSEPTRKSCVPKIFSSPCLRGSSCNPTPCSPCTPCPPCIPCPAIASSSCRPQPTIVTQPSPGPGLSQYISKRNLCPALRGCLSLYERPSIAHNPVTPQPSCCRSTCPPAPRCATSASIDCRRSRPSCAIIGQNSRPIVNTEVRGGASPCSDSYCSKCKPCKKCPQCLTGPQSSSKSSCQRISRRNSPPRCTPCSVCSYSCDSPPMQPRCTNPCCYSCTKSSGLTPSASGATCCISGSSRSPRRRLTVFDDPPYTSNVLEREFSSRFIRLDPCYCETDSSSSLDNSNMGSRCR